MTNSCSKVLWLHWPKPVEIVIFNFLSPQGKVLLKSWKNETLLLLSFVQKTLVPFPFMCHKAHVPLPNSDCCFDLFCHRSWFLMFHRSNFCVWQKKQICGGQNSLWFVCIIFLYSCTAFNSAHLNIAPVTSVILSSPVMQNHTLHLQQNSLYLGCIVSNSTPGLKFSFIYKLDVPWTIFPFAWQVY